MRKARAFFFFSVASLSLHAGLSSAGEEKDLRAESTPGSPVAGDAPLSSVPRTESAAAGAAAGSGALDLTTGHGALSSFTELSPSDLEAIASRLSSLAGSDVLNAVAGHVNPEEGGMDVQFVQRALSLLGQLLATPGSRELLTEGGKDPEALLRTLLQKQGQPTEGEEEEALVAILVYFLSLRRVLEGNLYLRTQVGDLIQENAEKLLADGDFSNVLSSIAASTVFQDLRDEVEEDIQRSTGYAPVAESGGDMS
ncbi:hypothetical protein, conserved [Eimeria maxima]|uniref:Uncharacterized protein n=1 Tax=Eimeria maxima TaxID=5804 RepID=U6LWB4_EIMMA|nr:hypothetical protein, conserved [Eimeria maxima]CDJ56247.1 hypothetical protein, conserved [Eimeria maxima]